MSIPLTEAERDILRLSFTTGGYSMEDALDKLKGKGLDEETARALIIMEYDLYKKEMVGHAIRQANYPQGVKEVFIAVAIISIMGPMMGITSPAWYVATSILGGVAGYFAYRNRPVAGVLAGLIVPVAMHIACSYYFQDRSSFIRIELVIPLFIAFIPSAIIFLIVSKLFYSNPNTNGDG
jgi:hypothetical protein